MGHSSTAATHCPRIRAHATGEPYKREVEASIDWFSLLTHHFRSDFTATSAKLGDLLTPRPTRLYYPGAIGDDKLTRTTAHHAINITPYHVLDAGGIQIRCMLRTAAGRERMRAWLRQRKPYKHSFARNVRIPTQQKTASSFSSSLSSASPSVLGRRKGSLTMEVGDNL